MQTNWTSEWKKVSEALEYNNLIAWMRNQDLEREDLLRSSSCPSSRTKPRVSFGATAIYCYTMCSWTRFVVIYFHISWRGIAELTKFNPLRNCFPNCFGGQLHHFPFTPSTYDSLYGPQQSSVFFQYFSITPYLYANISITQLSKCFYILGSVMTDLFMALTNLYDYCYCCCCW